MNTYIGYYFTISPVNPGAEILIAELGELGFESFVETDDGVEAFILKDQWNDTLLEDLFILQSGEFRVNYEYKEIEQVNWNEEWEKNFNPLIVDGVCSIRAPFHEKPIVSYDIIIEPKMSFGTGHHATTHMMVQYLLEANLSDTKVLDMGCGTGVLAILAEFKGAKAIDAIDIDNWCYLNTKENIERNHCHNITVYEGDATLLNDKFYDVIIANINRNILLKDIPTYASCLHTGGKLLLSGFYIEDLEMITKKCADNGLEFVSNKIKSNWIAALYELK
ncbi:50S ribosomal protein L11 methyltransferase [Aquimarina brevivitae]|uniref:50S ribosomal protein L11 methyltransferase n=1 Tax=Aquimarina brevivitae TaxID=323412 RepID=UPI001028ED6A|nr:50S ribosomal protein L11 methyltransferase [Aquimarina brevivitae]